MTSQTMPDTEYKALKQRMEELDNERESLEQRRVELYDELSRIRLLISEEDNRRFAKWWDRHSTESAKLTDDIIKTCENIKAMVKNDNT